jgi:hypothetical protein
VEVELPIIRGVNIPQLEEMEGGEKVLIITIILAEGG